MIFTKIYVITHNIYLYIINTCNYFFKKEKENINKEDDIIIFNEIYNNIHQENTIFNNNYNVNKDNKLNDNLNDNLTNNVKIDFDFNDIYKNTEKFKFWNNYFMSES
jgi:hypothetical protein